MLKKVVSVLPVSEYPTGTVARGQRYLENTVPKEREERSRPGDSLWAGIAGLGEIHVDFMEQKGHCLLASTELQFLRVSPLENARERWGCQDTVLARAEAGALIWSARPLIERNPRDT